MTNPPRSTDVASPDRRRFLAGAGALGLAAAAGGLGHPGGPAGATGRQPAPQGGRLPAGLFRLGVASGDPSPDGVVLWTRLAPDPLAGGGMPARAVPVQWEVAADERFGRVVRRGTVVTGPEVGHSVHALVGGLRPGAEYAYRFRVGPELSPVGHTRTAPAAGTGSSLRFVSASCQNLQDGYFGAWGHAVADDPELVVFLGDYIYEGRPNAAAVRVHEGAGEPVTLDQYRNRYAQYRSDALLQAAHAHCPWVVTFDDHEVDNNWAGPVPQDPGSQGPEAFAARRAAALQAWWEHMPVALPPPGPAGFVAHRRVGWGALADLHVLDTRQHRSDQVTTEEAAEAPGRTMTGEAQEAWLFDGLARSTARWQLVAQQTMVAQNDRTLGPGRSWDLDNWDGYRWQRRRLLEQFARTRNPVVLTGDRHATWVCDLRVDFDDPTSPVVGAELTGTSITSGGDPTDVELTLFELYYGAIRDESPHQKYIDNRRGYLLHRLDGSRMHTEERVVTGVEQPTGSTVATRAAFVSHDGVPGVQLA